MVIIYSLAEKSHRFFASTKNRYIALGCLLGLSLFFLFGGCGLNQISESEYYIGQDSRWRSLNLMGKERNFAAFTNDLLARISRQEKFGVRIIVTPTSELLPDLERGKLQGALILQEPSHLTENRFVFSDPYFLVGPVLIIPAKAPIEGWNEKGRKIVGMLANSHSLLNLEQDPTIQVKLYDDILKALSDLNERRIDGAILPAIPAYTYVTTFYKNELKIATLPLTDEGVRLVALKNEEGELLIKRFNEGLTKLKENGIYQKILEQWGFINFEQISSY
jgi:polar amino acid transport system substrate-binding protein